MTREQKTDRLVEWFALLPPIWHFWHSEDLDELHNALVEKFREEVNKLDDEQLDYLYESRIVP